MNDKIGYKCPPKASQFKPGRSGNPSGRPKQTPTPYSQILEELGEDTELLEGGRSVTIPKGRAMIRKLVRLAVDGDLRAMNMLLNFTARQTVPTTGETHELSSEDVELMEG